MRLELEDVAQNVNAELPRLRTAIQTLTVGITGLFLLQKMQYFHDQTPLIITGAISRFRIQSFFAARQD
jgi:hypothetical protein